MGQQLQRHQRVGGHDFGECVRVDLILGRAQLLERERGAFEHRQQGACRRRGNRHLLFRGTLDPGRMDGIAADGNEQASGNLEVSLHISYSVSHRP